MRRFQADPETANLFEFAASSSCSLLGNIVDHTSVVKNELMISDRVAAIQFPNEIWFTSVASEYRASASKSDKFSTWLMSYWFLIPG